jgi:hypothetical protein
MKLNIMVTPAEITSHWVYYGAKFNIMVSLAEYFKPLMLKYGMSSSSCEVKMVFYFRDLCCTHLLVESNSPSTGFM